MKINPVVSNPVLTKDAATLIIWLAAKYGFNLSEGEATAIAGVFFTGTAFFVRALVTPVGKDQPAPAQIEQPPTVSPSG